MKKNKILKRIIAVVLLTIYSGSIFAQAASGSEERVIPIRIVGVTEKTEGTEKKNVLSNSNGSGVQENVINFTGFPLTSYDPRPGIEVQEIMDESTKVIAESWVGNTADYAVVGHSQGGLRALAYANVIKQKALSETDPEMKAKYENAYEHLGAVITVSGIDKGIKMLEGGFGVLKSRAMEDVNILYNGLNAVIHNSQILGILTDIGILGAGWITDTNLSDKNEVVKLCLSLIPNEDIRYYISLGMDEVNPDEMKEIRDMMPYSNFIAENVADIKTITKKVEDGGEWSVEWRFYKIGWFKIPYLTNVYYPHYKVYTEYKEDKLKMDEDIPVAYIVGLNNDMCSLFDEDIAAKEIRDSTVATLKEIFDTAEIVHSIKTAFLVGLLTNSINYAKDARRASEWVSNLDGEIYDLIGSDENDCFIAKESQFYSREAHSKVLTDTSLGYEPFPEYNHAQINPTENDFVKGKIIELLEKTTVKARTLD